MKTSFSHTTKHGDIEEKSKPPHEAFAHSQDRNQGQPVFKKQSLPILPPNPFRIYNLMEHFTSLTLPINEVFNTFKDQLCVRRSRPIRYDPSLLGAKEYCSYHDCKGHKTIHCWTLRKYLGELIQQDLLKKYILTPEAASGSGQLNVPSPIQPQNLLTQYKVID